MEKLTVGQKIAMRRKLLCLSQEGLAERLEVSRQAVSKWESDAALPDIDKLITLCKLFDVSVGWLLGTEDSPVSPSQFTEEQLGTIGKLMDKYRKPSMKLRFSLIMLSAALILSLATGILFFRKQLWRLDEKQRTAIANIDSLKMENERINDQLENVQGMLEQSVQKEKLISDMKLQAFADENLENITLVLYIAPKVFQEKNEAYIIVENPLTSYYEKILCTWNPSQGFYNVRMTLPAKDGYQMSFLLVNDYSYSEEDLTERDPGFALLGTYTQFHLDPDSLQFSNMQQGKNVWCDVSSTVYEFNNEIYTPHIFNQTAVAYKDIKLQLLLNGDVIWEQSCKEDFEIAADGVSMNTGKEGIYPNISTPLPQLDYGDEIKLILVAETVNGGNVSQKYKTVLDHIIVESEGK